MFVAFAVIFQHGHLESGHQRRFPFSTFHLKIVADPFSEIVLVSIKDWNCVQLPKYQLYPFTLLLLFRLFLIPYYMLHMGQHFIITHTICQTEILYYQTLGLKRHIMSKCCVYKKNRYSLYFHKNVICICVGLLRTGQVVVSCKTVCQWVMTNCCFMSDILLYHGIWYKQLNWSRKNWQIKHFVTNRNR